MKRIIISLVLAALVLGAAAFEFWYVGRQSDAYTARIEEVEDLIAAGREDEATELCRGIERDWDSDVGKIYILLIHDYADNIGGSVSKMRAHLENGNIDMVYAESAGAKKGLASIKGSEYPFIENIL